MSPTRSPSADIEEEDLCRRAGVTPTNPYNAMLSPRVYISTALIHKQQTGSTQRSSRYVLEALPPNATLNNPKLTLNANNTPNPGVKFGSTTFSTQYSNPSGKLDPVAFDPASMVMKIPAAMNANVDIPNPTFKKVSIPLISDGGNTDSKSLSSGHI